MRFLWIQKLIRFSSCLNELNFVNISRLFTNRTEERNLNKKKFLQDKLLMSFFPFPQIVVVLSSS